MITYDSGDGDAPRPVRRISREEAARMIAANGGNARAVSVPFHGAQRTMTGADALAQLDEQFADPVELRAAARLREAQRLHEGHTTVASALRWLREHPAVHE